MHQEEEKKGMRVVVSDDFFFGRETVNGENGGMLCQGLVYEAAKGLMGSGGGCRDTADSIYWENWVEANVSVEKGVAIVVADCASLKGGIDHRGVKDNCPAWENWEKPPATIAVEVEKERSTLKVMGDRDIRRNQRL